LPTSVAFKASATTEPGDVRTVSYLRSKANVTPTESNQV